MNRNDYIKISLLALVVLVSGADAATLTVDVSGSANYMKIQDAINASSAGDTILVYSGTYYENVDVNKPLILRGIDSGGGKPVVNASRGNAINLSAGNGTVESFSVTTGGWPYTGIYVNSNNNNINSNNISLWRKGNSNGNGIFIVHSSGNTLKGNYAENFSHSIGLHYSDNNMLDSNIALNSAYGIVLNSSNNNTLSNNTAWNNWYGITLVFSSNNKLTNNNASNNGAGIGIMDSSNYNRLSGNTAKSNRGSGILLSMQSSYNSLSGNNIWENRDGINLYYSNNNTLNNNNASNNRNGIVLTYSINNTLSSNIVNGNGAPNNYSSGIALDGSRGNTLSSNIVSNNFVGIRSGSSYNDIVYNNFFNNTNNFKFNDVFLESKIVNTWNIAKILGTNIISGPYLGGNVWANPNGTGFSQTCTDSDRDEICDLPYKLDNYYVDQLPLAYKPGYYGHGLNVFSTGTPEEGSTEKAAGFEVVLTMTTLLTIYLLRRKRG